MQTQVGRTLLSAAFEVDSVFSCSLWITKRSEVSNKCKSRAADKSVRPTPCGQWVALRYFSNAISKYISSLPLASRTPVR